MRDRSINIPDSDLTSPMYSRCPTALNISSVLINPDSRRRSNLIRLDQECYKSLFDRIHEARGFSCPVYAIFKFAEIYLDGDLTVGDLVKITGDFGPDPIQLIAKFHTHDIVKQKYRRYHSDDRLAEKYREIAIQALELFQTFFDPPN